MKLGKKKTTRLSSGDAYLSGKRTSRAWWETKELNAKISLRLNVIKLPLGIPKDLNLKFKVFHIDQSKYLVCVLVALVQESMRLPPVLKRSWLENPL